MKNTLRFGLFAALAILSLSCTKESVEPTVGGNEKVQMTFTASNGAVTKTYLEGNAVKWHEDDTIGIHDGYSAAKDAKLNQMFTISNINPDGSATFTGTAAAGKEVYYATYPYDVNNFITEEGKMRIAFTTAQTTSRPETFDQKFNPSAAVLKDGVFTFKNLGGLLKFTLTNDNVKKVTVTANDKKTVGGVYYIYFDENGDIDDSKTTLASSRSNVSLAPNGSETLAAGSYYLVLSPRTYEGGMTVTFNLISGSTKTASTTQDVIVQKSKITNIGTFDTSENDVDPVTFPVVFPMGYPEDSTTGYNNSANTWVQGWANDAACVTSTRGTQFWTGHHGTLYSKEQPQAMMKWVWNDAIKAWAESYQETSGKKVQYFIETAQNSGNKISTVGVKGIWTGDYFEFVLPVENFDAETTLQLSMPIYTRGGPTFWEVKYKDGTEWKSTAVKNLPAYSGATVTADATWAVPYLETTSAVNNMQTVDMLFSNAIKKGEVVIRVQCVDGSIISSAMNTVTTGNTGPSLNKAGTAAGASFYFYNPGDKSNQDITIDILNI